MRTAIIRAMLVWLTLSVVGGIIIALPDDGDRVFAISETHGPSAVDLAGVALLLLGWTIFLVALWRVRRAIHHRPVLAIVIIAGAAITAWSVLTDTGMWWVIGAVVLVEAQAWAALSAAGRLEQLERRMKAG